MTLHAGSRGMGLVLISLLGACLPTRPEGELRRIVDDPNAKPTDPITVPSAGAGGGTTSQPHSLTGVDPPHGSFAGGNRVVVQGSGFAKKPRVWFGQTEVPAADVVAISERKIQVLTPPGDPGLIDVRVQNGDDASTQQLLAGGFTYDAFYADPDNGPTSGGTLVKLRGKGTTWGANTEVKIGDKYCESVAVASATELTCVAAAASPGSRSVTTLGDASGPLTVLDAFVYADSDNGYKGGLSGNPLPVHPGPGQAAVGKLRVIALDSYTGAALKGARVFLGTEAVATINASGVADLEGVVGPSEPGPDGAPLPARLTVTVARKCNQPTSFVGVGVDTVTMYLDPILSPDCGDPKGQPPPQGGKPGLGSSISGEVRFPSELEVKKAPWSAVPLPQSPDERRVAYLFNASSDPRTPFSLPDPSQAITEQSDGTAGYNFAFATPAVGNLTLYALAGIENRVKNPPSFIAYAFGVARGVGTKPGEPTGDVALVIDSTLDQAVTLAPSAPVPSAKGPDRMQVAVALSLGHVGYAILPGAQRTLPMPLSAELSFVGLPPLQGSLAGLHYVATALAGTGPQLLAPLSSAAAVSFQDTSTPVPLDTFVRVPQLITPGDGTWDGMTYQVGSQKGGEPPELLVFDVSSGGGLVTWTIAAPGDTTSFVLPDLRKLPGGGLVPGPVSVSVSAATFDTFSYDKLLYRHLIRSSWSAFAQDAFTTQLVP